MYITSRSLKRAKDFKNPFRRCQKCKGKMIGTALEKDVYLFGCTKCGRLYARGKDVPKIEEYYKRKEEDAKQKEDSIAQNEKTIPHKKINAV